jgi:hypothetical protein
MVEITHTENATLQGNVLFYSRPEPLSAETHAKMGVKRIDHPYAFAATSHVVPLTVTEFPQAALSCPIVFAGDRYQPLAVMGVNASKNIYISDAGEFQQGVYIPAYVRRYPFVLAADDAREKMVVCIDRNAPMLGDLPDVAFFDSAGQPTDYTKNCIEFCNNFEIELRRTEAFVNTLRELDLFETKTASVTPVNPDGSPSGPPQTVAEYYAVSDEKLKALPDEKIRDLLTTGALQQIYAHLTSLVGWDRLIGLAAMRAATEHAAPANIN